MNTMLCGFIIPLEVMIVLLQVTLPLLLIFFAVRYFIKYSQKEWFAKEVENQFNKYQDATFTEKKIKDYYPVKEGNKITLIQFDEIVDFSTSNNYLFLTDVSGKDYLVDSNLID